MYIYRITHKADGKTYVGSTTQTVLRRWAHHRCDLRRGTHRNPILQRAWNKYGPSAFEWIVVEQDIENYDALIVREQAWLDEFRSHGEVYNIAEAGASPMQGRTHTAKTRQRLREVNLGKKHTAEAKRKVSEARKGFRHTEKAKRKISKAHKGKQFTLGYHHTEETKRKISRAHKGKKFSVKSRLRMSRAKARPYPAFVHRETGEIIPAGVNLKKLCRERKFADTGMYRVKNGQRLQYKGWTLLGNSDA